MYSSGGSTSASDNIWSWNCKKIANKNFLYLWAIHIFKHQPSRACHVLSRQEGWWSERRWGGLTGTWNQTSRCPPKPNPRDSAYLTAPWTGKQHTEDRRCSFLVTDGGGREDKLRGRLLFRKDKHRHSLLYCGPTAPVQPLLLFLRAKNQHSYVCAVCWRHTKVTERSAYNTWILTLFGKGLAWIRNVFKFSERSRPKMLSSTF